MASAGITCVDIIIIKGTVRRRVIYVEKVYLYYYNYLQRISNFKVIFIPYLSVYFTVLSE